MNFAWKRMLVVLLTLALLAGVVPFSALPTHAADASAGDVVSQTADQSEQLQATIEEQIRAFADSIDKKNADDTAAKALAKHGLSGRGKKLSVGKTHALTVALMNSEVIQRTLIATCTQSTSLMKASGETALYLDLHTGWARFSYYFEIFRNPNKTAEEVMKKYPRWKEYLAMPTTIL